MVTSATWAPRAPCWRKAPPSSREIGSGRRLAAALTNLGLVENLRRRSRPRHGRAARSGHAGPGAGRPAGTGLGPARAGHGRLAGRRVLRQARDLLASTLDYVVSAGNSDILSTTLELAACTTAELGEPLPAARLAGAAEGVRQLAGMPIAERTRFCWRVPRPGARDHDPCRVGRGIRRRPRAQPGPGGHAPVHPQRVTRRPRGYRIQSWSMSRVQKGWNW